MPGIADLGTRAGKPLAITALVIALYIAQDSFGTACNVTGDGAIAVFIDAISGKGKEKAIN